VRPSPVRNVLAAHKRYLCVRRVPAAAASPPRISQDVGAGGRSVGYKSQRKVTSSPSLLPDTHAHTHTHTHTYIHTFNLRLQLQQWQGTAISFRTRGGGPALLIPPADAADFRMLSCVYK